jgi:hypothetical protein
MAATKRRNVDRPRQGEQKRSRRVVVILAPKEHDKFIAEAEVVGVPTFLFGRWLLTSHRIPGEQAGSVMPTSEPQN